MKAKFRTIILYFLSLIFVLFLILFFSLKIYTKNHMPDEFYSTHKEEIYIKTFVPFLNFKITPISNLVLAKDNQNNYYNCNLKFLNINLKNIKLNIIKRKNIIPYGIPFGAKIFTGGIMVTKFNSVETEKGDINPAEIAMIKKGDVITHINEIAVNSKEEFAKIIENSDGKDLNLDIIRGNLKFKTKITPVKALGENNFRVGIWIRDSSSGIGTMTFFNEEQNIFAGLGHGIRDIDTNELIPLAHGEIMKASIKNILKPSKNNTGELRGCLIGNSPIGIIKSNNNSGVFGELNTKIKSEFSVLPVAMKQEIKEGPAKIICTVEGITPKIYDVNIDKISFDKKNPNKNISISITDKNLIKKTGGIVQGMSGSPIIQNNMLIGAVNLVVSDNSLKGYGIFAETMINNPIFN